MNFFKQFKKWQNENFYLAVNPEQYTIVEQLLTEADNEIESLSKKLKSNKEDKQKYVEELQQRVSLEKELKESGQLNDLLIKILIVLIITSAFSLALLFHVA